MVFALRRSGGFVDCWLRGAGALWYSRGVTWCWGGAQEKVEWSSHWGGVVACNALFCLVSPLRLPPLPLALTQTPSTPELLSEREKRERETL